jgi:thiosulfate/3-mercaptopyruvate sulfurtransferase
MDYSTILSTTELANHLAEPGWVILDCRFSLAEPERGYAEYLKLHIPGATYVHLDRDLSAPVVRGVTGRHPLPTAEAAAETFSRLGIGAGVQVVAYDDAGGALAAARAWWMLRWLGHAEAAVLNGGWQGWLAERRLVRAGEESILSKVFVPHPQPELLLNSAEVDRLRLDPAYRLLDSRSADRYRGENETIDPVAGHIPGAVSAPYALNLQPDGRFRSKENLRRRFSRLMGKTPAHNSIFYCGSGVTAAHNILALEYAGLGTARLYGGSWSEWITDPKRPVER